MRGMAANRHLARAVMDGGFSRFAVSLTIRRGSTVRIVIASRWYPSSKTCSCCGVIKETPALSQRTFACDAAGRDHNAALNLARLDRRSAATTRRGTLWRGSQAPPGTGPLLEKSADISERY